MSSRMSPPKSGPSVLSDEVRFVLDRTSRWKQIGANWQRLTGFEVSACLGQAFVDFLHADDRQGTLEVVGSVLRGELYSCRLPLRCQRKDGRLLWMEMSGFPSFDRHGAIHGFAGVLKDVTDRRKGMRALRESEARFRAISEASPLGVCVTDVRGDAVYSNPIMRELGATGWSDQKGFSRGESLHPDDRERFLSAAREAMRHKEPFQSEHRYLHADGSVAWCRLHAAPILDGELLLGYVHVAEDVTAARLGEEALRLSQERLRLALEGSGVALMDMDLRSGQIFLSEQWSRFVGDPDAPQEISVTQYVERVHEDDQEGLQLALKETLAGQRPYLRMDYRIRAAGSQWRWIETHARVVERSPSGEAMRLTGTHADVTERKDMERLQAEFVATVSHELRTPLTSILGTLEVVQEEHGAALPAEARKFLAVAHRNSERLFDLVNDILDLEKVERGLQSFEFSAISIGPLLEQVMDLHDASARRLGVVLRADPVAEAVEAWTDGERLMQVMNNLISNAIKFSPQGGVVLLRAQTRADRVRVDVIDEGPGIPAEFQPRVFQRFAQAARDARRGDGSGLGLSICKALVEKMNGLIGFRCAPAGGSTFYLDLPSAGRLATIPDIHTKPVAARG